MPIGTYDQVVRDICVPCNTGWMEKLEVKVRPYLVPIFQGERPRLTYAAQATLAAWAWKTAAMILLLTEHESRAISRDEYAWFFNRHTPPYRSRVWIGSYAGERYREAWFAWTSTAVPATGPQPVGANVYTIPFTVGPAFFLVFGTSLPAMFALGPRGILRDRLRQIWPIDSGGAAFVWPPGEPVTDVILDKLGHSFVDLAPSYGGNLNAGGSGEVYGPLRE